MPQFIGEVIRTEVNTLAMIEDLVEFEWAAHVHVGRPTRLFQVVSFMQEAENKARGVGDKPLS